MEVFLRPGVLTTLKRIRSLLPPLPVAVEGYVSSYLSARLAAHLDHIVFADCRCAVANACSQHQLTVLTLELEGTLASIMQAFEARSTVFAKTSTRPWGVVTLTRTGTQALLYWAFARLQERSTGEPHCVNRRYRRRGEKG